MLYWFRTPPGVKVGRAALDEDAIRLIEQLNPGMEFDWPRILKGQGAPATESRPPVEARRQRPDNRRSQPHPQPHVNPCSEAGATAARRRVAGGRGVTAHQSPNRSRVSRIERNARRPNSSCPSPTRSQRRRTLVSARPVCSSSAPATPSSWRELPSGRTMRGGQS